MKRETYSSTYVLDNPDIILFTYRGQFDQKEINDMRSRLIQTGIRPKTLGLIGVMEYDVWVYKSQEGNIRELRIATPERAREFSDSSDMVLGVIGLDRTVELLSIDITGEIKLDPRPKYII